MKKTYERPLMVCENFRVDEYCSMCGDVEKKYYFTCDEDPGIVRWVYRESGQNAGYQSSEDGLYSTSYSACGVDHELTEAELSGLINGYVRKHVSGSGELVSAIPVLIWTGEDGNNCHCTTSVNIHEWKVNFS